MHSADGMRLSFSEVFGAQRSTAVSTNTDRRPSVTSQGAYEAVHQILHLWCSIFLRFGLVQSGFLQGLTYVVSLTQIPLTIIVTAPGRALSESRECRLAG